MSAAERERAWDDILELEDAMSATELRAARRSYVLRWGLPYELAALAFLLAVIAANYGWFSAIGGDYFEWFVDNGSIIALAFGVVAVAVDRDRHPGLIAADPLGYVAAIAGMFAELSSSLTGVFDKPRPDRALAEVGIPAVQSRYRSRLFDAVVANVFLLVFGLAMLAWAIVIAPLQYFVNVICGAPARMALASRGTVWRVADTPLHTTYLIAPKDPPDSPDYRELIEARDEGRATEITFATKPVTFTAAIAAAFLWGLSQLV